MTRDIDLDDIRTSVAQPGRQAQNLSVANHDYDERRTMRAWENLLSGASDQDRARSPVRSLIHDSWHRCATGGIDAQQNEAPLRGGRDEVEHLAYLNRELLEAARRSFFTIGRLLEGTGAMLVLADGEGTLIDTVGDERTLRDGMDIHLAIGGKWTEDVVGTNGIGTALWAGEPVFVHAAEHFCAGIKAWTCAGAPVRDPFDGRIIGVVDLSGHPDIFRPHNTALVAAAAREIEKALADQQSEERTRLLEAFITSAPRYRRSDGLMIVDRHGRVIYKANLPRPIEGGILASFSGAQARRLVELTAADRLERVVSQLPQEFQTCHVNRLELDGDLRGAALVFPPVSAPSLVSAVNPASTRLNEARAAIVGDSPALRAAVDIACRVSQSSDVTSLLIEGETGVGKELFARLVQQGSPSGANAPFVAVNCGAITRELFGSELFGHAPGAFTGASREGKPGVFELANGGVLSLDEIGEMPLDIQPFLLRVLEDRVVTRIGDSRRRPIDVRLVASTNRELKQEVEAGRFRKDLFYRISTVSIRVPPLRERGEDILLLLDHFNQKIAARMQMEPLVFTPQVLDHLMAYRWPGNVRELRNLVEKLHVLSNGGNVGLSDLPAEIIRSTCSDGHAQASSLPVVSGTLEEAERQAIRQVLAAEDGNLSRAARRLGVSRPTLYRKLDQYGIRRGFV
ncbi:sigma-54-dependent Fis family transcriptional regulator [Labrys sp. La1]|uniref:sigma-54-dependent Fis family transcriptional regulator n=1 Tax=Labrys sp. La1 TaxID=3404917 RepID=UPI003EB80BB5